MIDFNLSFLMCNILLSWWCHFQAIHHATTLSLTPETQHRIAHLLFALLQSTQRVSDDWHLTPRLVAALSGAASSNASAVDEDYAGTLARVLQSVASTV